MVSSRLEWHGDRVDAHLADAAADGIRDATEHLAAVARSRAPIETGFLQNTGTASVDRAALRGVVSFDGPYAARQHEELTWQHDPGRTAKYLEAPAHEEADTLRALVAASLRRALT